jgi:hypothetical protein
MLSSPDTAFQIVNGAYEKMLIELAIDKYIHIVELRLTSADNNSVTYEYCADHNNDWGKIHYTFGEDDYDVFDISMPTERAISSSLPQENGLCAIPVESTYRDIWSYLCNRIK